MGLWDDAPILDWFCNHTVTLLWYSCRIPTDTCMDDQYPVSSPDQDLQPSLHIRTQTDAVSVGTFITSSDSHFVEKRLPSPRTLWSLMRKSWMRKIWKILKNTVVNCKIYWEMLQYVKLIPSLHRLHPNLIVFLHQWLKWWNPRQSRCWWLAFAIVVVPTLPSMRLVRCHPQSHRWRRGPCPSPFGRKLGKWWKMKVRSNFWLWGNT